MVNPLSYFHIFATRIFRTPSHSNLNDARHLRSQAHPPPPIPLPIPFSTLQYPPPHLLSLPPIPTLQSPSPTPLSPIPDLLLQKKPILR